MGEFNLTHSSRETSGLSRKQFKENFFHQKHPSATFIYFVVAIVNMDTL